MPLSLRQVDLNKSSTSSTAKLDPKYFQSNSPRGLSSTETYNENIAFKLNNINKTNTYGLKSNSIQSNEIEANKAGKFTGVRLNGQETSGATNGLKSANPPLASAYFPIN